MRHGRLETSGVSTRTGEPWSWIDPFLPFIFIPGISPDICISWAESIFAEAKIPAPARTFCKNPRLLLMLFSFQGRMTEFEKLDVTSEEFRRTYTNATSLKQKNADLLHILVK